METTARNGGIPIALAAAAAGEKQWSSRGFGMILPALLTIADPPFSMIVSRSKLDVDTDVVNRAYGHIQKIATIVNTLGLGR